MDKGESNTGNDMKSAIVTRLYNADGLYKAVKAWAKDRKIGPVDEYRTWKAIRKAIADYEGKEEK